MFFLQWYGLFLTLIDAAQVAYLFHEGGGRLSKGTLWYGPQHDAPTGALLFTSMLIVFAMPRLFLLLDGLNQWLVLHCAIMQLPRLFIFMFLYTQYRNVSQLCTILLFLEIFNSWFYWRKFYSTRQYIKGMQIE